MLITVGRRLDELQELLDSVLRKLEFVFLACLVLFSCIKKYGIIPMPQCTVLLEQLYLEPLLF